MQVTDIIKAQKMCFSVDRESCGYCRECPLYDMGLQNTSNCQELLAKLTIEKLNELTELLDDKVNHHYYETLEFYQEGNTKLMNKVNMIAQILDGSKDQ